MQLDHNRDLTDRPNDAPAGELRPVFRFDGATHGAMMEHEAQELGILDKFKQRFHRLRTLPVPFTSGIATSDGETASCEHKATPCYENFCCTECGLAISEKSDARGWIFEGTTMDGTSPLGGALMCTGCVHAVCKFCPHMWVALQADPPCFVLRMVTSADDYSVARGRLTAKEHAATFSYEAFAAYRATLLREQRTAS